MTDLSDLEAIALTFPSDEETPDYIGRLDHVIRTLQAHRRAIMSEVAGPVAGKEYRIIESRECERSYNTPRLIQAFDDVGEEIRDLIDQDVLRVSWQWTKMRNLAIQRDIGLRIAGHELDPEAGEADHVGEHWKSKLSIEAVTSSE